MELTQLTQFKIIAELESITKAAELLHVSPPALSKSVKKLEEELGVRLFDRTRNTIQLNAAGKIALKNITLSLTMLEQMKTELLALQKKGDRLVIGTNLPASIRYFVPIFSIAHPEVETATRVISQDRLKKALLHHEIDLAIVPEPLTGSGIQSMKYCEEQLMLNVPLSHPLSCKESVYVKDLDQQSVIRDTAYSSNVFIDLVEQISLRDGIEINYREENDYFIYRALMKTNDYLYFGSNIGMKYNENYSTRIYIPFADPELRVPYYICHMNENRKLVQPFKSWLTDNYKELLL